MTTHELWASPQSIIEKGGVDPKMMEELRALLLKNEDEPMNGHQIKCTRCDGHGLVTSWSFGVNEPDECPDCGGSGVNWQYPHGAIARYYSGPLIGRAPAQDAKP